MSGLDMATLQVGDALPPLCLPPIDRTLLALFAGASGDHNPIHIDIDYAYRAGIPDIFAHGMLSMAWLGRLLTGWVDQRCLRAFGVRFLGITHVGNAITCTGSVVEMFEADGERRARIAVRTMDQSGEVKIVGEAVVAL